MKQIIPFKQELLFKTKISEITSISLEHTLSLKEDDLISGEFLITGDYKMTEGSINREKFSFNLPFEIALDSRYDTNNIVIDIDNFYYEVINNESLQVNIDVYFEGEKKEKPVPEPKDVIVESPKNEEPKEEQEERKDSKEEVTIVAEEDKNIIEKNIDYKKINKEFELKDAEIEDSIIAKETNTESNNPINIINNNINDFNIFENIDNSDTYVTYHVYIVKEEDTIDSILDKYGVTKEDLSNYNDITNIKPKDKIIIPNKNE